MSPADRGARRLGLRFDKWPRFHGNRVFGREWSRACRGKEIGRSTQFSSLIRVIAALSGSNRLAAHPGA
jgi:hypothetical protein